ncbi:MAG: DUF4364 family protein [Clostridia bacterium]|jgi:hypothetical protein|nr:DUF4364 family protein [Clostridia bacterium]
METRLYAEDEIKLFILYLMYHIGRPLEYDDINDIVMQDGFVGGIDFADCFADLLERGNVSEINEEGKLLYQVSDQGMQVLESLQGDLMNYVKTRGLRSAMRLLDFRKRGAKVETSFEPRSDGCYDLTCAIRDNGPLSLELKLVVENSAQLELMRYQFRENPEQIYKGILALLTGEIGYFMPE